MIARSLPFTLQNVLERVGRAAPQTRNVFARRAPVGRLRRIVAALEAWPAIAGLAWPKVTLLRDQRERFERFCRDCVEETPHDGFDECGPGWYVQICRCRYCGEQSVKVWLLGCW